MLGLMSDRPLTLNHAFGRAERLFPDKRIATVTKRGVEGRTYGEWAERTRRLVAALGSLGLSDDARIGTFAWNSANHLELYFGAPCSGRVLHTINIRLFPEQVTYIVDHAADEAIFVDRSLLSVLHPLIADMDVVRHIVVMDDGGEEEIPDDPRISDYEELLAAHEPGGLAEIADENQAAAICYTSGTTGNPKGVLYSHRSNVLHAFSTMLADTLGLSERDIVLPVVPMFHANAWGLAHASVMAGAGLAMPGPAMTPEAIADLAESEAVTLAAGVPTIWQGALDELERRELPALRGVLCGGSAVPRALSEAYRERLGLPIKQAWGMTETSPIASVAQIKSKFDDASDDELADLRASQGLPAPLVDIRIIDQDDGSEQPWDGEARGELQAAGPWVAAQYYRGEGGGEQFTDDGWLKTGDVATVDPDGYIRLVDRTKDLVKSGGEWISSVELENEIMAHPKIAEAAVIGVPDEKWSERPLACIVVADGERLEAGEIKDFLDGRVAKWWIPESYEFIDEVPKTSVGKFSKKALRERFAEVPA